jgi:hypothetical protein
MKKTIVTFLTVAMCGAGWAQENPTTNEPFAIITDRPDFTESAQTVPAGRVQIEGGASFDRAGDAKVTTIGETLIRVATGRKSELRIGVPSYLVVRDGGKTSGLDDGSLGVKFALAPGSGFGFKRPALGVIVGTTVPSGARRIAARNYAPEIKLAAGVDLNERWAFATNLGIARPKVGGERFTQLLGTASLALGVSDKIGAYFEAFAFSKTDAAGNSARYVNTGLTYQLNPEFQLDARVGLGIKNDVGGPDFFYGIGAARLF